MTLYYLDQPSSSSSIYSFLADEIKDWFTTKFHSGFTPPQLYTIPSIHARKNTLIFSSTGSGKTFAAFLAAINELFVEAKKGKLKDQIYVLYISPLKALGNDIKKNLEEPLQGIQDLAASNNIITPKIRVGVRTGDTPQSERVKMLKTPPQILITTPESLGLILTSPKFSLHLKSVRWVIIDEIHEVSNNKRGTFLSLCIEYLQAELAEKEFTRIGLSATQAPIEEIARFLVGRNLDGKERDCYIANLPPLRKYDLEVISPVKDLLHTPYILAQEGIYTLLADLILDHETSIVFTNTRKGAENVAFKLKEFLGPEYASSIAVHHSSLSREIRLDVEDKLKNNELLAVISSTSLELGIDIGSAEIVSQVGSPKSVAKYLQRVGRSGHSIDKIAKGRLLVTDRDDALECSVLTKSTYIRDIDKVQIPENCLDVLAQLLVGFSIVKRWNVDDAYKMIRCSYSYRNLNYDDFINILEYLGGYNLEVEERKVYRKIWYDHQEKAFGKKRNTRLLFYTNIGTIPDNADFSVELETYRTRIGRLSESFVEKLTTGDVIVLGSHTYQFKRTVGSRVVVSEAFGRRPTVPSWVGEMLPRSFELSLQIGRFIDLVAEKIKKENHEEIKEWIMSSFKCDEVIAKTIIQYINEQVLFLNAVPSDKVMLVESFIDPQGRMNIIFHAYYGRRVNDTLSRSYAYTIGKKLGADIASAVNDNGFILILPLDKIIDLTIIPSMVTSDNLETLLKQAIVNTELFQLRFRHVANRALMILRHSGNRPIPVSRQSQNAKRILPTIKHDENFCVIKETYREILQDYMDIKNSIRVIKGLEKGEINFHIAPFSDFPSPFAHGIVLLGVADVVQIADRSALLRELHQQVLQRVYGKEGTKEILFSKELVERIFNNRSYKNPEFPISSPRYLRNAIKALAPLRVIENLPPSIYHLSIEDPEKIRSWALDLHNSGDLVSIPISRNDNRSIIMLDFPLFWNIYVKSTELDDLGQSIIVLLKTNDKLSSRDIANVLSETEIRVFSSLYKLEQNFLIIRTNFEFYRGKVKWKYTLIENIIPKEILNQTKNLDPEECLKRVLLRYLKVHGPSTKGQIAEYLKIEEEKVDRSLSEFEQDNKILKGQFVEGTVDHQYITLEDRELLRNLSNRSLDSTILSNEDLNYVRYHFIVEQYLDRKITGKEAVLNILGDFGSIEDLSSLNIRIQNFELDWLRSLIEQNELIRGRFSHNRLAYVSREVFPHYYSSYSDKIQFTSVENKVLSTIKKYGSLTKREISEYAELDSDITQESIMLLDKTLHLVRKSLHFESFIPKRFTPNVYDISTKYLNINTLPSYKESQKFIILKHIHSLGPVSVVELTQISGFRYSDVESIIKQLLKAKNVLEKKLTERDTNYYLTKERYEQIVKIKANLINNMQSTNERIVIIPRNDPFAKLGLRMHLRDIYGEGHIDPILLDGSVIGSIEYKLHRGRYLQVYDLKIDADIIFDFSLLQKIAAELTSYIRNVHKVLSLQIEDINGRSILSKSNGIIRDIFIKTGFRLIQDTLVGGETITRVFKKDLVEKFIMDILWLRIDYPALNSDSLLALINQFGWLSLEEIFARFPDNISSVTLYLLNKLLEEKKIIYLGNAFYSLRFARYRKSGLRRRKQVKQEHVSIYKLIQKGNSTIAQLTNKTGDSIVSVRTAINALETNVQIGVRKISTTFKAQEYWDLQNFIPELEGENLELRANYIYDIVKSFGVATEEQIIERASITSVISKIRVKEAIAKLVEEERLLAGRFVEDTIHFFYITKKHFEELEMLEKQEESLVEYIPKLVKEKYYLLPPHDIANVILRNLLPEQFDIAFKNYTVVINQKIAAQFSLDDSNHKKFRVNNVNLAPWVNTEMTFNYIINAVQSLPSFYPLEVQHIVIERINGISVLSLVK